MNTKSIYTLIIFLFSTTITFSQAQNKTENYTHHLAPVKISLTVIGMENVLTPLTAGVLVEGHLKDKLFYNVQFRQGYLRNFLIAKTALLTTQKESKGTVFEAGVEWPFYEVMKEGKVKVVTEVGFDDKNILSKYFIADCEVRKFWALTGGVLGYTRPKYINSDSSEYIISNGKDIKSTGENFTHFNQSTIGSQFGIMRRKIKKAIISRNGRDYRAFYSTKFYAQALLGRTSVGDIVFNNQQYKIDNAVQVPLGYRLGWMWDQMGVVTSFEFGKMPGVSLKTPVEISALSKIFSQNPFLNYARLSFHFNIFNADKHYFKK